MNSKKKKTSDSVKSPPPLVDPVTSQLTAIGYAALKPQVIRPAQPAPPVDRSEDVPIALVVSDTHLSTAPPTLHADNPDWFGHISRNFEWLFDRANEFNVPILIAGDVFDKAVNDSKLLSFVISLFNRSPQPIYTVAGNHDLPFHSIDRIEESGYAVLLKAGVIIDCSETQNYRRNGISVQVHGYHWLKPLHSTIYQNPDAVQVALVHRMITDGTAGWYPGCEPHAINAVMREFKHFFHYAVFGDNHAPFVSSYNQSAQHMGVFAGSDRKIQILNPGSFMRRTRGELELSTRAYVLQSRTAVKLNVPTDIARNGELRGNVDAKMAAAENEPEGYAVSAFASLPSFMSASVDGVYVVPDMEAQYRQYISTLCASESVCAKLAEITGIASY